MICVYIYRIHLDQEKAGDENEDPCRLDHYAFPFRLTPAPREGREERLQGR
jgi:hypothetical protein